MTDKLAFLLALSRERHFGRAAISCGVTQPTLSAGIKHLETSLGVLLVQRGARFGGFTPEGERVLEWARRIVGDTRAMRDEVRMAGQGLRGHLRLAAVPTSLPAVARLTTPLRERHPGLTFSVRSCTSLQALALLENLEVDAGLTYVGREKLGRVRHLELFTETYRLLIARDSDLGRARSVSWAQVADIPLCLLTPDMQNRRIIDERLAASGHAARAVMESNSMILLVSHVRTGRWASVMPALLVESMGLGEAVAAVEIEETLPGPLIGLVYPQREPLTPVTAALVTEARRLVASGFY